MPPATPPPNEAERLRALRRCHVLDSGADPAIDRLVTLATDLLDAPIGLVSLVDEDRQWFKACSGLGVRETPRDHAICAYALYGPEPLVIEDASTDPRTADNPLVAGEPCIRFYAGCPLVLASGHIAGTLCVIDREPRSIGDRDLGRLGALAQQVATLLDVHRERSESKQVSNEARALRAALDEHSLFSVADRRGRILDVNEGFCRISGYRREELLGRDHRILNSGHHPRSFWVEMWRTIASGEPWHGEVCNRAKDGSLYWVDSTIIPQFDDTGRVWRYVSLRFDITQKKRAEADAEAMRARVDDQRGELQSIIDAIPAYIFYKDDRNTILDLNRTAAESIGRPADEIRGRPAEDFFSDEHAAAFLEADREVIRSGEPSLGIEEIYAPGTAEERVVRTDKIPLRGPSGDFDRLVVVAADMTEITRAYERLATAERRLTQAMKAANIGIWEWDVRTGEAEFSDTVYTMLGYEPGEFASSFLGWKRLVHPEDLIDTMSALERHLEGESPTYVSEHRQRRKDGSWCWIRDAGEIVERDERGRPTRLIGVHIDVSELKDAFISAELAQRAANAGRWDWRIKEGIVETNDAFHAMLGEDNGGGAYRFDYFLNRLHPDDVPATLRAVELAHADDARDYDVEFRLLCADGSYRWIRSTGAVIERDADGTPTRMLGQHVDTHRSREALREAEAANRAKSEFLANMSHEIRTPMTAILGYTDLLLDPETSEEGRCDHVRTIKRNAEHLLALINDVLDVSKIEAGQMEPEMLEVDPSRILDETESLIGPRARGKGVAMRVFYDSLVPDRVLTDPTKLRQILVNLAGNAVKFTSHGAVAIRVVCDPEGRELRFHVSDTGAGMTEQQLERIRRFEAFTQADTSTTRRYGGTGLGLRISNALAEMLGGRLEIASMPGVGSTFTLVLPTGDLEGALMRRPNPLFDREEASGRGGGDDQRVRGSKPLGPSLEGLRILLAEDGPDNQRLIGFFLRKAGAEVEVVENGRRVCDALGDPLSPSVDVVLMDMQMPELDGYAATRKARAAGHTLPIIALTAHALAGDRQRCLEAGCDDYLTKPVDRSTLLRVCKAMADGHRDSRNAA